MCKLKCFYRKALKYIQWLQKNWPFGQGMGRRNVFKLGWALLELTFGPSIPGESPSPPRITGTKRGRGPPQNNFGGILVTGIT